MKCCLKCLIEKQVDDFSTNKNTKDGLQVWCRQCNKDYRKSRSTELKAYDKQKYQKNSESIKARVNAARLENPEKKRQSDWNYRHVSRPDYEKSRYRADVEKFRKKSAEWRSRNPDKVKAQKEKSRLPEFDHQKRFPWLANARNARRRAAKWQRTPFWSEKEAIKEFYKNCPKGYHVDHIVPLRGETVSGLHVLANLQYLPASENCAKGNKFQGECRVFQN